MFIDTIAAASLADFTPQVAGIAAAAALLGWIVKGAFTKSPPAKPIATQEPLAKDRSKSLENSLEKAKAAHKSVKSELEALQAQSVSKVLYTELQAELETLKNTLQAESKRASVLDADLKKASETLKNLNAKNNEHDRAQKDRSFALENELSKARQQIAILEARPDDSTELHAEILRLKESIATTTRYTGELRKREAAAVEALAKLQAQVASGTVNLTAAPQVAAKPQGDSERVAAAKAEVLRLLEKNKQSAVEMEVSPEPESTNRIVDLASQTDPQDTELKDTQLVPLTTT